jgi:hypothetical protein
MNDEEILDLDELDPELKQRIEDAVRRGSEDNYSYTLSDQELLDYSLFGVRSFNIY